jgi:predicted ATPase/Tfp pilus assembly protein PilF
MTLRTLGRLALDESGLARPKPLALLAFLAVEGPQDRRHLAELFWPTARDHMKSLAVALTQIRRAAPGAVEADRRMVRTSLACDAVEMLDLLDRGDREAALARYRGPFLDGFYLPNLGVELEEWVYRTREYLAGRAQRALLDLADAAAARRRFGAAAAHAERAARLGAALADVDDLTRMHTLLLAGGNPAATIVAKEASGLGLDLEVTADAARARLGSRLAGAPPATPQHLPMRGTAFVGRDPELAEVASSLARDDCRLLTLLGPAGVGKSRLALQVAHEQLRLGAFPDGVHHVALDALTAAEAIPASIAQAMELDCGRGMDALDTVVAAIGTGDVLLVCDNLEHLAVGAETLSTLVRRCPHLTILVTSRERLHLEEERVFPVSGLAYPQDADIELEEAVRFDAVQLLVRRAKRARPDFELRSDNLADVLTVCRVVEGLPLALELAAVWARVMPMREIAESLERSLDLLVTPTRNVPDRHRSIRAAFDQSWQRLNDSERAALRRTAVFRGGFRRSAAGGVAGATVATLASLVDKSLLRVDASGRYDRHPLVLEYTREKLAEQPDDAADADARHHRYFVELLASLEDALAGGQGQRDALVTIEEELENVLHAWSRAAATAALDELWVACRPLQLFFTQRGGLTRTGADAFAFAAAQLDPDDPDQRPVAGRLLVAEAWFRYGLGDTRRAAEAAESGTVLLRGTDGRRAGATPGSSAEERRYVIDRAVISGLNTLGHVAMRRHDLALAERLFSEALAMAEAQRNDSQVAILTSNLALLRKAAGDFGEAERLLEAALERNRARQDDRATVRNLTNLGGLMVRMGRPERAAAHLEQGLRLANAIGYDDLVPNLLLNLGATAFTMGRCDDARRDYHEALTRKRGSGDESFEADAHCWLGRVEVQRRSFADAERHLHTSLTIAWEIQQDVIVLESVVNLAELRLAEGDARGAAALLGSVADHSALTLELRKRAEALIDAVRAASSPEATRAAMGEGASMPLERLVASVTAGPTPRHEHR